MSNMPRSSAITDSLSDHNRMQSIRHKNKLATVNFTCLALLTPKTEGA